MQLMNAWMHICPTSPPFLNLSSSISIARTSWTPWSHHHGYHQLTIISTCINIINIINIIISLSYAISSTHHHQYCQHTRICNAITITSTTQKQYVYPLTYKHKGNKSHFPTCISLQGNKSLLTLLCFSITAWDSFYMYI